MRHLSVAAWFLAAVLISAPLWAAGVVKWQRCTEGLDLGDGSGVVALSVGGRDNPTLYAIVDGKGLFRSLDLGQTWPALGGEVADDLYCIAARPDNGQLVYAGRKSAGKGLWVSPDGGVTWSQSATAAQGLASDDIESITFVPGNPQVILLGHRAGPAISTSTDSGKSWHAVPFGKDPIANQLVLAVDAKRWLVATRGGDMQQQTKAMVLTSDAGQTWAAPSGEFDYFAGPLPVIQVGDAFFSTKHHGTNKSEDAGANWAYKMESHTRVVGSSGEVMFREGDRQFIRGTQDRILNLEVSDNLGQSWTSANGNLLEVIPPAAKPLITIPAQRDPFAHIRLANAWASVEGGRDVWLSLGKAGLYHGTLLWSKSGPRLAGIEVKPLGIPEGAPNGKVTISAWASMKRAPVKRVYADLSGFGLGELPLLNDSQTGGKRYANSFNLPAGSTVGPRTIAVIAEDDRGNVSSAPVTFEVTSRSDILTVFNGEQFAAGLSWLSPPAPLNSFKAQAEEVHSGKIALEMHGEGSGFIGGGWNWHGWYPADARTDIRKYANLSFWIKSEIFEGDRSGNLDVSLVSNNEGASGTVEISRYCPNILDGQWHEVIIPLADIYTSQKDVSAKEFDPSKCWMINIRSWAPGDRSFSVYLDDIGFDNRLIPQR